MKNCFEKSQNVKALFICLILKMKNREIIFKQNDFKAQKFFNTMYRLLNIVNKCEIKCFLLNSLLDLYRSEGFGDI